ncbi:MAG: lysophospholipase [Chitinophagales bacterium]|nr:lysophospholipase [Chitinophagales bacterium]
MSNNYFTFLDQKVHYQYFLGDTSNAIIVLIHGLGEHSGRYELWARKFNAYNYGVCALDLPGHGLSNGKRGYIYKFSDFYKVIDSFLEQVKLDFPNKPLILYGHSMGGNILSNYVLKRKPQVKAIVLSSPWFKLAVKPNAFKYFLGKLMHKIYPEFHDKTNLNPNFISRIPEEVEKYKTDKLVHGRITPALFFPLYIKGMKMVERAKEFYLPTLVFHGSGDNLTSHEASKKFASGNDKIDFLSIEGGFHELHHDLGRDELFEKIIDWLAVHVVMR